MRRPTPDPYAWHRKAIAGEWDGVVTLEEPQAGWFKTRLVKKGPFVPARIWLVSFVDDDGQLVEDEQFYCEVNGSPRDAAWEWQFLCTSPISQAEYNYMTALQQWARQHAPSEPEANPKQPVDWMTTRPSILPAAGSKSAETLYICVCGKRFSGDVIWKHRRKCSKIVGEGRKRR